MKYYIIAGEASGDLHGSNLIRELRLLDSNAVIRCWGGDKMQQAGGELVKHYRELAFMGFTEVLMNLRTILKNLSFCKKDISAYRPDALVLIDYPGFNLRIAKWARSQGLKVIYYISPQVWAWKENRVKMMKENIDKMIVILPFEKNYFKTRWNWDVEYAGHPLVDVIEEFRLNNAGNTLAMSPAVIDTRGIVAILPGSRKQEIIKKLPVMLEVSRAFPKYRFVVAKAPGIESEFYDDILRPYGNVTYVADQTYSLLNQARAAMVTSGTATLETALFGVPEVVCYKGSPVSYFLAKKFIKVKYISLVNLIMDRPVVTELIQDELTVTNLRKELNELLHNETKISTLKKDYAELKQKLTTEGKASAKAARSIFHFLRKEV